MRLMVETCLIIVNICLIFMFCGRTNSFFGTPDNTDSFALCGLDRSKYESKYAHPLDFEYLAIKKCVFKHQISRSQQVAKFYEERPMAVMRCKETESIGFSGCVNYNRVRISEWLLFYSHFDCEAEIECLFSLFLQKQKHIKKTSTDDCLMVVDKPMFPSNMEETIYRAMFLAGVEHLNLTYRNDHITMHLEDDPVFYPPEITLPDPNLSMSNPRFIDQGNQTLTDTQTGLTWEMKTKQNAREAYIWDDAKRYCEGLTLAGFSDWYLPSSNQLLTIEGLVPSYDDKFFPYIDGAYWASEESYRVEWGVKHDTQIRIPTGLANLVFFYTDFYTDTERYFNYAETDSSKKINKFFVLCVCDSAPLGVESLFKKYTPNIHKMEVEYLTMHSTGEVSTGVMPIRSWGSIIINPTIAQQKIGIRDIYLENFGRIGVNYAISFSTKMVKDGLVLSEKNDYPEFSITEPDEERSPEYDRTYRIRLCPSIASIDVSAFYQEYPIVGKDSNSKNDYLSIVVTITASYRDLVSKSAPTYFFVRFQ